MYVWEYMHDVQVVSVGLEEETCPVVDYDECLTPAERLLPPRRQPKPGEPQVQNPLMCTLPPPALHRSLSAPLFVYYQSLRDTSRVSECRLVSAWMRWCVDIDAAGPGFWL